MFHAAYYIAATAMALTFAGSAASQDREPKQISPARQFEAHVQKGMPYKIFRSQVQSSQWVAKGAEDCANTVSADVCAALPELDTCSADGYCLMTFSHPQEDAVLRVSTYGDILRLRTLGEETDVQVYDWGYE